MMIILVYAFTLFSIGLYAGALLTEAFILAPYWRKMVPEEFFRLHGSLGPTLFQYYAPLTAIAVFSSIVAMVMSLYTGHNNIWHITAASLCVSALAIFFFYFKNANNKFKNRTITANELPSELLKWSSWHWVRTILVLSAFLFSIIGNVTS